MQKNVLIKSPSKINIRLDVGPKRGDGYHEINTLFARLQLADNLEVGRGKIPAGTKEGYHIIGNPKTFRLGVSFDAALPEHCRKTLLKNMSDNFVMKAYGLIRAAYPSKTKAPLWALLHKAIPTGAGLGGGSSNAGCALQAITRLLRLRTSPSQLNQLANKIGSDVAFFLRSSTRSPYWWGQGRGEKLTSAPSVYRPSVLVIYPGFSISTDWAYRALDRGSRATLLTTPRILPTLNAKSVAGLMRNSFEKVVLRRHPVLAQARKELMRLGAENVSLTGSGSCLFALSQHQRQCRSWAGAMKATGRFTGFHYYVTGVDKDN